MTRSLVLVLALTLGCGPKKPPETVEPTPTEESSEAAGPEIRKNALDDRDYAYVELDNGLRAVVISDPDTDMAAVSVRVSAGKNQDPPDRPGLAHFLEHMLFMGNAKYPDVDEYRTFIESNGGGTNAGTGSDYTEYHFDVEHSKLEPAFDRMAQFFISPTLDPAYVERERNAVHSEFSLKIKDEGRRIWEVEKKSCNQAHPCSKFSVGNLDTLGDRDGDPVYEDLRAFYEKHYRANRMTVSVIGREDTDTLVELVREKLSAVPTGDVAQPVPEVPPFTEDQLGVRIHIVPLSERRSLDLQFPLPDTTKLYDKHPTAFSSLIGHEGEGSLLSLLKSKGWAESLSAGASSELDHDMLSITIGLTKEGFAHVDDVTDHVFQYLRLLRESGDKGAMYYDEARRLGELSFRFRTPPRATQAVMSATWALYQGYPVEHLQSYWSEYADYDAELTRSYLDRLTPENVRQVVVGPGLETDRVETLYDVPWAMKPLDARVVERWKTSTIDPALHLPAPNEFIPDAVELKSAEGDADKPAKVHETATMEVWHDLDTEFEVPRANVRVRLHSPAPKSGGLKTRVLNELFAAVVQEDLNEFAYPLQVAGLSYGVSASSWGLSIRTAGYDQKQPELLAELLGRLDLKVETEPFELRKARMLRGWRNSTKQRPISQSQRKASELLVPAVFDQLEAADVLEKLTAKDLQAFVDGYFDRVFARVVVHGNMAASDAKAVGAVVEEVVLADAKPHDLGNYVVRTVPKGKELVRTIEVDHNDSTIVVQWTGHEPGLDQHARYRMLATLWDTPFFSQLRTEQQLGYTVWSYKTSIDELPSLRGAIQSPKLGPTGLLERIDAFAKGFRETLGEMPEEEFATLRAGLITSLTEADTSLGPRTSRYVSDLWGGYDSFDRRDRLVAEIEKLDKPTMMAFYDEVLLSKDRARLIVQSVGKAHRESDQGGGCTDDACVTRELEEHTREM